MTTIQKEKLKHPGDILLNFFASLSSSVYPKLALLHSGSREQFVTVKN